MYASTTKRDRQHKTPNYTRKVFAVLLLFCRFESNRYYFGGAAARHTSSVATQQLEYIHSIICNTTHDNNAQTEKFIIHTTITNFHWYTDSTFDILEQIDGGAANDDRCDLRAAVVVAKVRDARAANLAARHDATMTHLVGRRRAHSNQRRYCECDQCDTTHDIAGAELFDVSNLHQLHCTIDAIRISMAPTAIVLFFFFFFFLLLLLLLLLLFFESFILQCSAVPLAP
jgi:hypothetical protein